MSTEKNKFIELAVTVAGLIVNSVTMATLCSCGKRKLTNRAKHLVSITAANLVAAIGVVLINLNALRRPGYNMFCLTWSDLLVEDVRIAGYILIMLGLCSLSADLYLSVNHSMRYQIHSRRITNATIAGTWTLGLCLGFLSTLANQLLDTSSRPYQARYCDDPFPAVPPGLPPIRTWLAQMNATKREQFAATAGLPAIPPLPPVGASDQPQSAVVAHWLLPTPPLPPVYDRPVMSEAGNRTDLLHLVKYLGFATQSAVTAAGLLAITVCMALIYRRILRPSCGRPPLARRRRGACTILILLLAFLVTTLPSVAGELYMLGALLAELPPRMRT